MGFLKKVISFLFAILSSIFGSFKWTAPRWLSALGKINGKKLIKALWVPATVVALIAASIFGYNKYLESLPKITYTTVTTYAPSPTNPESKLINQLTINFSDSAAPIELIGKPVEKGVSIYPEIKGVWKWAHDKSLVFEPTGAKAFETDWLPGTDYIVSFTADFFPKQIKLENYKIAFTTAKINLSFNNSRFYIDPKQPELKKVVTTVFSNAPLDTEALKKKVSMNLSSRDEFKLGKVRERLKAKIRFNKFKTEAYIESPNLKLFDKEQIVTVSIAEGIKSIRGGEGSESSKKIDVTIPGRFSALKIDGAKVIFAKNKEYEPEQVLVFNTGTQAKTEDVKTKVQLLLLPKDHTPPGRTQKNVRNYNWTSASEVTEKVRQASEKIDFESIPTERSYSEMHSLKVDIPVNRYILFTVSKGVQGYGGFELSETYSQVIKIPKQKPEVFFMSSGSLLTLSGDLKVPVLSRSVKKIKYNIGRTLSSQNNFLISKLIESNDFSNPHNLYSSTEDLIMEKFEASETIPQVGKAKTHYSSLDLSPYVKAKHGFYYVKASSDESYSESKKIVLISDMGIIAKRSRTTGETHIFTQNLRSGKPVSNATVAVIGQNGLSLIQKTTNSKGYAIFPDLKDFKNEKSPLAFTATKGSDVTYLPFNLYTRRLNFSRFDVGGAYKNSQSGSLTAMLFSDRGLYRPGDKVNLGLILRSSNAAQANALPLNLMITDPRGKIVFDKKIGTKISDLQDFSFQTKNVSPTGQYLVDLKLIKKNKSGIEYKTSLESIYISVEEFQPDKLKIRAQVTPNKTKGWSELKSYTAEVTLKNMFGSPAQNRDISARYTLTPTSPRFKGYESYKFINPNSDETQSATEFLKKKKSDDDGIAKYDIDLDKYKGYFNVTLKAEGFEAAGGRSVETSARFVASHLKNLVGFKADGDLDYIKRDGKRTLSLIAFDNNQAPSETKIKLELKRIDFVSSLTKQNDGTYKYKSVEKEVDIETKDLTVSAKGLDFELPSSDAGAFVYYVKNTDGEQLNKIKFNIVGDANLSRSLDRNAELKLTLNKKDFKNGEFIEIQVKSPYTGSGLITIERDEVYSQKWFKMNTTSSVQKIQVPEGLDGNAYVNVTLLRDIASSEIYMSPLSYGAAPFSISLDEKKTKVSLSAPKRVRPGEEFSIDYSSNKPGSIVIYGVDEGILQVAKYKTPKPLKHFFKKQALQVDTFQLLDLLLPEYSVLQQVSSTGGDFMDEAELMAPMANLNPFKQKTLKPVVFWSGVLQTATTKKTYKFKVPDHFNGGLKIMAVASSSTGLGSTDVGIYSKGDFIITPTAPIFMSPSDKIEFGVSVSNQLEDNGKDEDELTLSLGKQKEFQITGENKKVFKLKKGSESTHYFQVEAGSSLGNSDLVFAVTDGEKKASYTHNFSIRPAVPLMQTSLSGMITKMPSEIESEKVFFTNFAEKNLSLSGSPLSASSGLIEYLDSYPHGCTEQIVSKTVPHLAKTKIAGLLKEDSAKAAHDDLIANLRTRQLPGGGFGLYPGSSSAHIPASLYVVDYLNEAYDMGLKTPDYMQEQVEKFIKNSSLRGADTLSEARQFAHAIYLQARLEIVPSNDLNFLRELLAKNKGLKWQKDAVAIYLSGTYAILQQPKKGWQLIKGLKLGDDIESDYFNLYDRQTRDALLINIVARHYPEKLSRFLDREALTKFMEPLMERQFNTISSAQIVLALAHLDSNFQKNDALKNVKIESLIGKNYVPFDKISTTKTSAKLDLTTKKVKISGESPSPLFYSLTQKGFTSELPTADVSKGIEASRTYKDKDKKEVTSVNLGEEVFVTLNLRSQGDNYIPNVVSIDLIPAGFELVLNSVNSYGAEYVDKRDDRLVFYTSVDRNLKSFTYTLKAVQKGNVNIPPTAAESMYDKKVYHHGKAGKFEIK